MSDLQHERLAALALDLRLPALPNLYGAVARTSHSVRMPASQTFWRRFCGRNAMPGGFAHGTC
jgi:hypothetical protein